jgi:hypothetical protein
MNEEQKMNVRFQLVESLSTSGLDGLTVDNLLDTVTKIENYLTADYLKSIEAETRQTTLNLVN